MSELDVIVVGGGHNGLVTAILLARAGLKVHVLEQKSVVGGAVRTEKPFAKAPNLAQSTGAYLLGLMPPELIQKLGVDIPVKRRDPHYFVPTTGNRYLMFGSDAEDTKRQFIEFFSKADWEAHVRLQDEIAQLRADIAPTWLSEPFTIEETAERYVRPALRQIFVDLCRKPIGDYLDRFGFKSDLIKAMYAVTDAFSGSFSTWDTPGSGMNFLIHNMCRLPDSDGTWMVVEGGMGTVSSRFADAARAAGAIIETNAEVLKIEPGSPARVHLKDGRELVARTVIANADPYRLRQLVGEDAYPAEFNQRLDAMKRPGSTMKVNLALRDLPTFTCLPQRLNQHGATMHILPDESVVWQSLKDSYDDAKAGRLPEFPTIEWYVHTPVDPTMTDEKGRHSSALFVQWVPYEIAGSSWEVEADKYAHHLLSICDQFAPDTSSLVDDMFVLHPKAIESHFGITYGHIHHIDNIFGFADRHPYRTPAQNVYSCSAGCHPAGSVIGASGHNAAMAVLKDLGLEEK